MRSFLTIATCCLAITASRCPALETKVGLDLLPAELAKQIYAYIQVNNTAWLSERATELGTGMQLDVASMNGLIAEGLFGCRSLKGIDVRRPALFAWREGAAPLVAILPLADRQAFLKNFGMVNSAERFLLLVGERDGTLVYHQTGAGGTQEYRMLIRDGYAYLATTVDECERMSERPLPHAAVTEQAPLIMATTGASLARNFEARLHHTQALTSNVHLLPKAFASLLPRAGDLLRQIATVRLDCDLDSEGLLRLTSRCTLVANSDLAVWTARQVNNASRLLPIVERAGDLITSYGAFRWKGEMEAISRLVVAFCQENLNERFTPEIENDLRNYFRMADDMEGFAQAVRLDLVRPNPDEPNITLALSSRSIADLPRASDFLNVLRSVDSLFLPPPMVGDYGAHAALLTYASASPLGRRLILADRNWLLAAEGPSAAAAQQAVEDMLERRQQHSSPQGDSSLVAVRLHLHNLARQIASVTGRSLPADLEAHDLRLDLRSVGKEGLELSLSFPVQRTGMLFGRAGLRQMMALQIVPPGASAP